jgi:hypothetical protein
VRFKVLMTVIMNITVLLDVMSCGLAHLANTPVEPAASIFRVEKKVRHRRRWYKSRDQVPDSVWISRSKENSEKSFSYFKCHIPKAEWMADPLFFSFNLSLENSPIRGWSPIHCSIFCKCTQGSSPGSPSSYIHKMFPMSGLLFCAEYGGSGFHQNTGDNLPDCMD